jgi:hypothetical protein
MVVPHAAPLSKIKLACFRHQSGQSRDRRRPGRPPFVVGLARQRFGPPVGTSSASCSIAVVPYLATTNLSSSRTVAWLGSGRSLIMSENQYRAATTSALVKGHAAVHTQIVSGARSPRRRCPSPSTVDAAVGRDILRQVDWRKDNR